MPSKITLSYVDHGGETSFAGVRVPNITPANIATIIGQMDAIRDAIDGVTIMNRFKDQRLLAVVETAKVLPADQNAQRESKWLVRYTDNVNPVGDGSFEIPGADLSLLVTNTQVMNLAAGAGLALKAAIDAGGVSVLGNAITMVSATHVGRKN